MAVQTVTSNTGTGIKLQRASLCQKVQGRDLNVRDRHAKTEKFSVLPKLYMTLPKKVMRIFELYFLRISFIFDTYSFFLCEGSHEQRID